MVRLKAFLNSTELIDSPTARELYKSYRELNNQAVRRLAECEVLLQKKQKIEAVVLVQQEPNLFDLIDSLYCPERKDLLALADLYDWPSPDAINFTAVSNLRKAVSAMDDLRPLLTEFRRIARTDQVKYKLHLLREITRIDKGNQEWRLPLVEIENQYVSQLIAEAQKTIQDKDFVRLEEIYEELKNSHWVVTIPTIVLQKVEKIVLEHRREEAKKRAMEILEKINGAYGSFDVAGLEDAFVCWNEHCKKYDYSPDEKESLQLKEATAYLDSEKKKQKEQQEFQTLLDHITSLLDSAEPLAEVEKNFAKAQASGLEIPDYVSNRVAQYRRDIERDRRAALIIKSLKIIGTAAAIMLVITGAAIWVVQSSIETQLSQDLLAVVEQGDIPKARSKLNEIETKYPKLAKRPKIIDAKAALDKLISEETDRAKSFEKVLAEINALRNQRPPDDSLKEKIVTLEKLAKGNEELQRVRETRAWIEEAFRRREEEVRDEFWKKIETLKTYREEILACIKREDFEQAEKSLLKLENLHDEITNLINRNPDLLSAAAYKDLLKSSETLRAIMFSKRNQFKTLADARQAIVNADNFASIEAALRLYEKTLDKNADAEEFQRLERSMKEISYFKAILNFQSGAGSIIPSQYAGTAYFKDVRKRMERAKKLSQAKAEIAAAMDSLQKNTNRLNLVFVRVQSSNTYIDIYASDKGISAMFNQMGTAVAMKRTDGVKVTLKGTRERLLLTIGEEDFPGCRLIYPTRLTPVAIRASRAPHQVLIQKFFSEIHSVSDSAIIEHGIRCLDEIRKNEFCAPYWKMKLSLRILEPLAKVDLSPGKQLAKLKDELQVLQALDNIPGDPLDNKFLGEKIAMFFRTYDFSLLEKARRHNAALQKLFDTPRPCRIQCLGYAAKVNNILKYAICSEMKSVETEVFYFDPATSGIELVGRYGKNGLILDDKFQEKVTGHLLFTSDPPDSFSTLFQSLKKDLSESDLQHIDWPDFWPINMRGEGK
ncbi:MAG: hypothetical protein J5806_11620 [Lentisphaeria bacterium]|nr:hypothetical protein [Lentisphaeria bacterium]